MDHQLIEEQDVIDRYLLRQLSPAENEAFEAHYFACDECFAALQTREKLVLGAKFMAWKKWATVTEKKKRIDWQALIELVTPARLIFATAAVIILLLCWPAYRGLVTVEQLQTQLQQWQRPQANVLTYSLNESSSGERGVAPIIKIPLKNATDIFLLSLTLPERKSSDSQIRAEILDQTGAIIWQEPDLQGGGEFGNFTISCPGGFFKGGAYRLRVTENDLETGEGINEFWFRFKVVKR